MGNFWTWSSVTWTKDGDRIYKYLTSVYQSDSETDLKELHNKMIVDCHWSEPGEIKMYLALLNYLDLKSKQHYWMPEKLETEGQRRKNQGSSSKKIWLT